MGARKRNKAQELKKVNKNLAFAKLNNCPTSPRKMRLVADLVRGMNVESALTELKFNPKEASRDLKSCYCLLYQIGKLKTRGKV